MKRLKSTLMLVAVFTGVLISGSNALMIANSGTKALKLTVYASECPPEPLKSMPCVLEPTAGFHVCIYYYQTIYPGDPEYPKDYPISVDPLKKDTVLPAITKNYKVDGMTNAAGQFEAQFDFALQKGAMVTIVYADKKTPFYITGNPVDSTSLYLQPYTVTDTTTDFLYSSGYSSLKGKITFSDSKPAVNAKVHLYRDKLISVDTLSTISSNAVNLNTVTDSSGSFSFDSIFINMSGIQPASVVYIEAELDGQKTATKAELWIGKTSEVGMQLSNGVVQPLISGISSIEGTVYTKSILETSNQAILKPVPACTLVVTNDITPLLNSYAKDSVPPTFQGFYIAITDSNGHFKVDNVKIWSEGASFVVMAQSNGRFATTTANLYTAKTIKCDVILDNTAKDNPLIGYLTPEMIYYNDNKSAPVAVRKSYSKTEALSMGNVVSFNSGKMVVSLKDAQQLTIGIYSLNGKLLQSICKSKNFASGNHLFDLNFIKGSNARVAVKITGENFNGTTLLNPIIH